jgi:hypothetical protein
MLRHRISEKRDRSYGCAKREELRAQKRRSARGKRRENIRKPS